MHSKHRAEDEFEITGDLPLEPCAVLTFPPDRGAAPAKPLAVAGESQVVMEDDEPTIVEALKKSPPKSSLYQFIFTPHYKTALSVDLHRYLRGVRSRFSHFRENHLAQHPDSGFQKIRRLIARAVQHAKRNLAVK